MKASGARHLFAMLVVAAVVATGGLPAGADDGGLVGALPLLSGGEPAGDGRPAVPAEPQRPTDRFTPPAPLVRPDFATVTTSVGQERIPVVIPRSALPFRFSVDRRLAARHGERAVYDALRQWDGIGGSRWATAYGGLVDAAGNVPDGQSVVFLQDDCPPGTGGYAHWQTASAAPDARYGARALYVTEVDVAICTAVVTPAALRQVVAHEVGHALGLDHLCDPGQGCWQQGMGPHSHACRLMYAGKSSCGSQPRIRDEDRNGAVHLYPRLPRLGGPSRVETAARASYAGFGARSAGVVVLADAGGPAHGPLAAAALSGALGAPFLLASPDKASCLTGAAAEELSRVAAQPAKAVLVGAWPASCTGELRGWGIAVERIDAPGAVQLGLRVARAMADSGRAPRAAVLVSATADSHGHVPDGVAGGAAAAAAGGPVLFTGPDRLDPAVRDWLRDAGAVRQVYVLGGPAALSDQVLADLRAAGVAATRVSGRDRVATALALASRPELFAAGGPVVLVSAASWPDAVTGSALGARERAPVLLTPAHVHDDVHAWLAARRPRGGWIVGGAAAVPHELQWRYARQVS